MIAMLKDRLQFCTVSPPYWQIEVLLEPRGRPSEGLKEIGFSFLMELVAGASFKIRCVLSNLAFRKHTVWNSLCKTSHFDILVTPSLGTNLSRERFRPLSLQEGTSYWGFFKPGNSSGSNYHLGIWYGKVSLQTEVWVANRNNPSFDPSSAELKLLDGNLVLFNESRVTI
ncbi:hypothetical protein RJ641_017374 [Dillenia turbinata]|uniref:Bulb-type lectin domain-containing protein n=1 Tax=Dillenia turbinata TaxID=194707 RepID=A0AAN8UXZ4_9MAGN